MSSLGEEYPKEQARCRELLIAYKEIGPPGRFAASNVPTQASGETER